MKIPYWPIIGIPLLLMFFGAASNQAVLVANWGKFPVMGNDRIILKMKTADAQEKEWEEQKQFAVLKTAVSKKLVISGDQFLDDVHSIMGPNSRLKFLADYIDLKSSLYSPGDLLVMLGQFLWPFAIPAWVALVIKDHNTR